VNKPTREELLGYLLGALDAPEHEQVAICLQARPDIRLELSTLRERIAPLSARTTAPDDFPVGLARRTCEAVARLSPPTANRTPPVQAQSSRPARRPPGTLQSAAIVCLAAVLGGTIGPAAYQTLGAAGAQDAPQAAVAIGNPISPAGPATIEDAWMDRDDRQYGVEAPGLAKSTPRRSPAFAGSWMPIRSSPLRFARR
jgi:hypothetical protein